MLVAYVAGPYRDSRGEWYVWRNIETARQVARELWRMGFAVICPHANTAVFGGSEIDDSVWLQGDLELLRRCDIVVMLPDWTRSEGAKAEHAMALNRRITAFYWDSKHDREMLQKIGGEYGQEAE